MEDVLIGVTDRTILVFIPDPASTTGAGKTGLAAADVTVTYTRVETDNDVVHTDVTSSVNNLSALTDAHNDWGWKEVNSSLSKGLYRLDIADAVFASGAWYAAVQVTITTGTSAATPKAFRLVARNDLDGVRLGLTALPNAAADSAGGLPISDTGGLDLDAKIGALTFTVAGKVDANTTHAAGTAWGSGAITAGVIATGAIDADALATDAVSEIVTAVQATYPANFSSLVINGLTGAVESTVMAWANAGNPVSFASGYPDVNVARMNADVVTSSAVAASAVTEIQSGLATSLALATVLELIDTEIGTLVTNVAAILEDTGTSGVVVASASKTGYALASDGLDSINTTAPSGVASNFREMVVQVWRRFFKRATKSATQIKTYADNGTSVLTTQAYTSSGDDDDVGAAS